MEKKFTWRRATVLAGVLCFAVFSTVLMSSSHREAPLIADDRQADNTDVYAFRSPANPDKVVLIANFIPGQLPSDGPNYYHFSENIRYEIHVDNDASKMGDEVTYRWTFKRTNEDPTTFFNIRLGKENLKNTYTLERIKGGVIQTIVTAGVVPPYNVGPRSISSPVGLNAPSYESLMMQSIMTASTGEKVFAGPVDDPFFVDAGGIFDLGDAPRTTGSRPRDHLRKLNVHTLALEIDIATLQKTGKPVSGAANILDGDYVIGVWASASRQKMRVLNGDGTETHSGDWVQVSRLGMPLTNEAIIPIGWKDKWNSSTPYQDLANLATYGNFFYNPELALYMDDRPGFFGPAVPAFKPLRIQLNSLGAFGFGNGQDGLFPLKGSSALAGTALGGPFADLLLPGPGKPRSVDIWPIFHTGVPNQIPYQLAAGKGGNPLAMGKPFINNFLPNGGDMLRLNMAVPVTPRNSPEFSTEGLVGAAVLGLTDARFNTTTNLQFIPNMDGFPNGRRLEDDVTRIELQAVAGVVLAAIGLPYDDYMPTGLTSILEVNSATPVAKAGYTSFGTFNGHSYYKSNARQSWFAARASARAAGGYLTTISSEAENDFIYVNGVRNPNVQYSLENGSWIGLNDAEMEGNFMWENGEPVTYTRWEQGEPSGRTPGEDFVLMQIDNGKWNDVESVDAPITAQLLKVLGYQTGINRNDTALKSVFPFVQTPWPGTFNENCDDAMQMQPGDKPVSSNGSFAMGNNFATTAGAKISSTLGISTPQLMMTATPNPTTGRTNLRYRVTSPAIVQIVVTDANGRTVNVLRNAKQESGIYNLDWDATRAIKGVYFISILNDGVVKQTLRVLKG